MAEEGTAAPVGGLFVPWLGTVVADLDFDAGGHPFGFVAVVDDDAAVGSGLELESKRHLRRALNHAREPVRQLAEVESELGIRFEIAHEGAGGDQNEEERFHELTGVIRHVPSFFARR